MELEEFARQRGGVHAVTLLFSSTHLAINWLAKFHSGCDPTPEYWKTMSSGGGCIGFQGLEAAQTNRGRLASWK